MGCGRFEWRFGAAASAAGGRVIYFWRVAESQILLVALFAK